MQMSLILVTGHALASSPPVAAALRGLAGHRHRARWEVAGVEEPSALFGDSVPAEGIPLLRRPTEGQDIAADYRSMHLSLERHPMSLL